MSARTYTLKAMEQKEAESVHAFFARNKQEAKAERKTAKKLSGFAEISDSDFSKEILERCNKSTPSDLIEHYCFIAKDQKDTVVGVIIFNIDKDMEELYVTCLGRSPSCKKQGMGKNLLRLTAEFVKTRKETLSEGVVLESSKEAQKFYSTMGFKPEDDQSTRLKRPTESTNLGLYLDDSKDALFIKDHALKEMLNPSAPTIKLTEIDIQVKSMLTRLGPLITEARERGIQYDASVEKTSFNPPYAQEDLSQITKEVDKLSGLVSQSQADRMCSMKHVEVYIEQFFSQDVSSEGIESLFKNLEKLKGSIGKQLFNLEADVTGLIERVGLSEDTKGGISEIFLDELNDACLKNEGAVTETELNEQFRGLIDALIKTEPSLPSLERFMIEESAITDPPSHSM